MHRPPTVFTRVQQGHRNLALVLGEMAERNYKQQYGLLIADDLTDRYEPTLKKGVDMSTTTKSKTSAAFSGIPASPPPVFQPSFSFPSKYKRESLPEIGINSSTLSQSMVSIPSIVLPPVDAPAASSTRFGDIMEENEEEEEDGENQDNSAKKNRHGKGAGQSLDKTVYDPVSAFEDEDA